MKLLALLLLLPLSAQAEIRVAFFEIRDPAGNLRKLEPGGHFAHVALAVEGGWLQAYPGRKVEIVPEKGLARYGQVAEVLTLARPAPTETQIKKYLGYPYDPEFSWDDDKFYCAELLAKILGIEPTPMQFSGPEWGPEFASRRGELGISPDELYEALRQ